MLKATLERPDGSLTVIFIPLFIPVTYTYHIMFIQLKQMIRPQMDACGDMIT